MPTLAFRNRLGEWVDVPSIPASQAKNEFGSLLDKATHGGAVAITRHDAPKAVLVSFADFESLVRNRDASLEQLDAEFDALLARMQTPQARRAAAMAFAATPAELGRAAVAAARKSRGPSSGPLTQAPRKRVAAGARSR